MSPKSHVHDDRGPIFADVNIGRPATGALIDIHGVGPKAALLKERLGR